MDQDPVSQGSSSDIDTELLMIFFGLVFLQVHDFNGGVFVVVVEVDVYDVEEFDHRVTKRLLDQGRVELGLSH